MKKGEITLMSSLHLKFLYEIFNAHMNRLVFQSWFGEYSCTNFC